VSKPCVMIMAGGTGGHVFPALSLAGALRSRDIDVVWLGTRAGIEARLVPAAGIDVEWIDIGGLRGKNLATLISAPLRPSARCGKRSRRCAVTDLVWWSGSAVMSRDLADLQHGSLVDRS